MKRNYTLVLIALVGSLVMSCGNGKSASSLYDQLMALHDATMSKMDDVFKLKQQLTDSLKNISDSTTVRAKELIGRVEDLNAANKTMMDWMHQFKEKPDSMDETALSQYYSTELEKMKKIRDDMDQAIAKAQNSLKP